ncbi:hypothetical protein M501DRAFT_942012 [Patellaria atrata CBS 101060]|uniref:Aromatic-L-amino-acid decarboxylase n=1 Tax=Patellaria atrata CBS 101060 TaxID=1346257 RepID=A0A9P4S3E9_9PEZI|nr:hypothetical protein M501DRAFT_942012 [Patellaria atrata CBS 101060]
MDEDQFRKAAHSAIEEIISYRRSLPSRRVLSTVQPGYLAPQLPPSIPTEPEPWDAIQPDIDKLIVPGLTHWASPNFMAFFPAHSTYASMLGELYSAAFSAPAFNWLCSPAITELETVVLDWVAKAMALPESFWSKGEGGGVVQGSASEAVVTVMVAARERMINRLTEGLEGKEKEAKVAEVRGRLVALGSEHSHSATHKGAIIAGTHFRIIPASKETGFAMTGEAVERVIKECEKDGLIPYYLTATLGTTSTCAVDDFEGIKETLRRCGKDAWVHVDAAYAGAALVCEEYQHLSKQLEGMDSFDFNMHKWLLTNFDASCLYVRHRTSLTSVLSITPPFLRNQFSDHGLVTDYRDWQIPLGRRFRAIKIWFVLRAYGLSGLQSHIRRTVKLGQYFHSLVQSRADLFGVVSGPQFALTVVTIKPLPPTARAVQNELTRKVYETVNKRGEVYLTNTVVGGVYAIRVVGANPTTQEEHLRRCWEVLVEVGDEVRGEMPPGGGAR